MTSFPPYSTITRSRIEKDYKQIEFLYQNWANRRTIHRWAVRQDEVNVLCYDGYSDKKRMPAWIEIA